MNQSQVLSTIQNIQKKAINPSSGFIDICNYLKTHHLNQLYDDLVAPGYASFNEAKAWFNDYYVMDQNDGIQKVHQIAQQIQLADKTKVYVTQPDYEAGYDYMPNEFVPVSDKELQAAMTELITKIQHPTYHMYAAS